MHLVILTPPPLWGTSPIWGGVPLPILSLNVGGVIFYIIAKSCPKLFKLREFGIRTLGINQVPKGRKSLGRGGAQRNPCKPRPAPRTPTGWQIKRFACRPFGTSCVPIVVLLTPNSRLFKLFFIKNVCCFWSQLRQLETTFSCFSSSNFVRRWNLFRPQTKFFSSADDFYFVRRRNFSELWCASPPCAGLRREWGRAKAFNILSKCLEFWSKSGVEGFFFVDMFWVCNK